MRPSEIERNWMRNNGRSPTVDEHRALREMREPLRTAPPSNPYRDRRLAQLYRAGFADAASGRAEAYPGPEPLTKGTDWRQRGAYRSGYRAGSNA